jgi:hypothetical protein
MSEMTELAARLPWVTRLDEAVPCEGLMSHTPLKAVYRMSGHAPVGLDQYRCKNRARWQFTAQPDSGARDGTYCWPHLLSRALHANMAEIDRTRRGLEKLRASDTTMGQRS